jgi:hypothetical protein
MEGVKFLHVGLYDIIVEIAVVLKLYCIAYFLPLWMTKLPLYIVLCLWIKVYDYVLLFIITRVAICIYDVLFLQGSVYGNVQRFIIWYCSQVCIYVYSVLLFINYG